MGCNDNQSFCKTNQTIGGNIFQIVQKDDTLSELLNPDDPLDFLSGAGYITSTIWDLVEKTLVAANKFGDLGSRNYPPVNNSSSVIDWPEFTQFDQISATEYNKMIDILKASNTNTDFKDIQKHNIILSGDVLALRNYIEKYKIDTDRCDSCNTSCYSNYSCGQGSGSCSIGSYSSCYQSCGQGCSGCQGSCQGGQCLGCNSGYTMGGCGYNAEK